MICPMYAIAFFLHYNASAEKINSAREKEPNFDGIRTIPSHGA